MALEGSFSRVALVISPTVVFYTLQDRLASRIMENESRILVCHFLRGLWASLLPTPLPSAIVVSQLFASRELQCFLVNTVANVHQVGLLQEN